VNLFCSRVFAEAELEATLAPKAAVAVVRPGGQQANAETLPDLAFKMVRGMTIKALLCLAYAGIMCAVIWTILYLVS
jgi:hypothetical protein